MKKWTNKCSCALLLIFLLVLPACSQKFALMIGGCAEKSSEESMQEEPGPEPEIKKEKVATPKIELGKDEPLQTEVAVEPANPMSLTLQLSPIYFAYSRAEVRDSQKKVLLATAQVLKKNNEIRLQLQGNCDERGTVEYNLALGERRALQAKKYLINLGINKDRLSTVSFGEERPKRLGHNEEAWAENRRVDFVQQ